MSRSFSGGLAMQVNPKLIVAEHERAASNTNWHKSRINLP
jgi:hypothetical protein